MNRLFRDWGGQGRTVATLSACWALAVTGNVVLVSTAALAGHMLAPDPSLATLPILLQWTGTAGATIPASLLMRRVGRRWGFVTGVFVGCSGAALAMAAIYSGSFSLLCLGIGLLGAYNGFNGYYRFAASDAVTAERRSRAISLTLAGGVAAAVLGPTIAKNSINLFASHTYMGAFAAIILLGLVILVLLSFARIPAPRAVDVEGPQRPMGVIARQPVFIVAAMGGAIGYGIMVLLMSVTPLAMIEARHAFGDAAQVIEWHVIGMFAPAFFTGHLIRRFGVLQIMLTGVTLLVTCVLIGAAGTTLAHFRIALTLLGVGWNFCYVGGTTLLTESYTPAEKAKTQALNDFLVFASAGFGSFFAGTMLERFGWEQLNMGALPFILAVGTATFLLLLSRRAAASTA